jgi:hypothetical protein
MAPQTLAHPPILVAEAGPPKLYGGKLSCLVELTPHLFSIHIVLKDNL